MTAPYLIVGCCGDSNGFWGKFIDTNSPSIDATHSRISAYGRNSTVYSPAAEPLPDGSGEAARSHAGYGLGDGHKVGSTLALCRLIISNNKLPPGYDILIVVGCSAGESFVGGWATGSDRSALDPFLTLMSGAMALHSANRVWFFDWNHGANDGGRSEAQYQADMVSMWGEVRSTVSSAARCPILVPGIPPNRVNPALGNDTTLGGVMAAQANVASYLQGAKYIDMANLTSIDNTNGYVHLCAADHRGGTNNAPGNSSEVQNNPLSARKYEALFGSGAPGWRMKLDQA